MDYKSADYFIYEQLVRLENAVLTLNYENAIGEEISKHKNKIVNKSYRVAVIGEFKRGKSSLINALLGSEILPADITPTTATVNRITYGINPRITVNYKDGHDEVIGMNQLSDYVTKLTKEGESRAKTIKETIIEYPTPICRNYVDIIDTPGLNDNEEMTAVTLSLLENIDAAIVAISAKSPFSGLEKNYICDMIMNNDIYDMVFAVTFIDAFSDDETRRLITYISEGLQKDIFLELKNRKAGFSVMKKAHRILDNPKICGVSSYYALESEKRHDAEMYVKSGIDAFTKLINTAFNSGQSQSVRDGAIDFIENFAELIDMHHHKYLSVIEKEALSVAEISNLFVDFVQKYDITINRYFENINDNLKEKFKEMYVLKNNSARCFVKAISSKVHKNTNEEIREVVLNVFDRQEAMINAWIEEEIIVYLNCMLNDAALKVAEYYYQSFKTELDKITIESQISKKLLITILVTRLNDAINSNRSKCTMSINESMEFFKKIKFVFLNKSFLDEDLVDRNIIDDILDSIDASFNEFKKYINDSVTAINNLWCEKTRTRLMHLSSISENIDVNKIDIKDEAVTEYMMKYEFCIKTVNSIIRDVQSIKE